MGELAKPGLERICPGCHGKHIVEDEDTGDLLCADCGYVLSEKIQRPGPEWRSFPMEGGRVSPARGGPPISLMKPDMGLSTTIEERRGSERLRSLEAITYYTPKQRSLGRALKLIGNLARKLDLGQSATVQAAHTYRKAVQKGLLRGRSIKRLAVATVYASCRESGIPRSLNAVADAAGLRRKFLAKEYRRLAKNLELAIPVTEPERYIARIASLLSIDELTTRKAYSILARAKRNRLTAGKDPKGIATTALYVASLPLRKGLKQKNFSDTGGTTGVTLRKRSQELKKYIEKRD